MNYLFIQKTYNSNTTKPPKGGFEAHGRGLVSIDFYILSYFINNVKNFIIKIFGFLILRFQ